MAAKTQYKTRIMESLKAQGYDVQSVEPIDKNDYLVTIKDGNRVDLYHAEMSGAKLFLFTYGNSFEVVHQPVEPTEAQVKMLENAGAIMRIIEDGPPIKAVTAHE